METTQGTNTVCVHTHILAFRIHQRITYASSESVLYSKVVTRISSRLRRNLHSATTDWKPADPAYGYGRGSS